MSQQHDESFKSIGSEDNEHNASGSGSGSSSGSESDSDSCSSSSGSSRHSSPERSRQTSLNNNESETAIPTADATSITKAAAKEQVAGLPATEDSNAANNGYNSDEGSDSGSNSDSDSNDSDEATRSSAQNETKVDVTFAQNSATAAANESSNNHNTTNNTTTSSNNTSNTTENNTSHTTNDESHDDSSGSSNSGSSSSEAEEEAEQSNQMNTTATLKQTPIAEMLNSDNAVSENATESKTAAESEEDNNNDDEEGSESAKSSESSAETVVTATSSSSSEDDADDYQPHRPKRQVRKPPAAAEKSRQAVKKKRKSQNWDSDESVGSEEESDASPPPRRKLVSKPKPVRRGGHKKAYSTDDSEDDSKRFGTRRAAAAVSYKEASEDDKTDSEDLLEVEYDESQAEAAAAAAEEEEKAETIERILAKRQGRKGCTGNQTTIYAIEEVGCDPNEGVDENDLENTEVHYQIKWKGWSHIHNTWESEETLREQKVKGMKKLENFIKRELEIDIWRRRAGPEDIDYFECQQELGNDLLKSYNFVDRIISCNEKEDSTIEYLCKWQSLPYSEATWEDGALVMRKWQRCVEQYDERENSKCTPSRHCKTLKYRPKFYKIKEQPDFLKESLVLRDYQMDGLNWLLHSWCKENSVILADEMGLGKTIQTICFLYSLFKIHHLYGPFLCVVPLSTMTAWQREFDLWAPEMNVVTYLGDVKSREMIRQYEWQFDGSKRLKFNCILTTYEIVLKDKLFLGTLQWSALLVDEAHRLKNDDSLLYKSLKEFETNHRLLITGTPLQNSLKELWALLHFIMPEKFITWEDFEREHGNAADKGYTKLHQQLEPYILRRVKKDVEKSLPAKVEQILRVEMTSLQKQYYKWILTKNFDALRKGKKGSTSTFLNIVIELKKCCNHAALIRPSEFELMGLQQDEALQTLLKGSGKMVLLDKLLCRLKETGHRVLIFSQMVRMLDVLADYLQKRHFSFQRLDGSIKGEMRKQALDHYNAEGSQDFCFLLSTRAGGLGINLATADTVIIFDSDWNPQNDLQAQARAHRIGQKNQVNIYRLVTARSVEEQIVERAKQKMVLDHLVIQRMDTTGRTVLDKSAGSSSNSNPFNKDDLSAILKFGAEELFKDEQENDDELVCDIDEILRRAETRNEDPEMPADDLLSAFKVASIAAFEEDAGDAIKDDDTNRADEDDTKDWDDIIPEDFRRVIENEEKAKEIEDLYLPPRRKTAANQADTPNKRGGRKGQNDESDSDYDMGSDASGEEGGPKRRGRPAMKEKIIGFTDTEIRRFIKSYKKFPAPLMRLEAIACDAELQEKPLAELKRVGEMLHDRCVQFMEEHKDELNAPAVKTVPAAAIAAATDEPAAAKQKRSRATYSVKLGGVSFNAKTLITCEEELKPLNEIIPSSVSERLNWTLNIKSIKQPQFDVEWGVEEDSKLLCGIYQYGIGSWEQMKMDPSLRLTDKILLNDARKPQAKNLQSRSEYLLKIIKKNLELKKGSQKKQRKPRKPRENKTASANIPATPEGKSRQMSESHTEDASQAADGTEKAERKDEAATNDVEGSNAASSTAKKKNKRAKDADSKGKSGKAKKSAAADSTNKPMHFTANNEPRALEVLGDLDPNIFNECKEKMRPVKKALKALDRPDSSLSDQEQVKHTRECLLSIGKQIDICLEAYSKETEKKEWRSNLWYFVSKFTEYDTKKLFKLYKYTLKQSEEAAASSSSGANKNSSSKSKTQSPTKKSKDSKHENGNKEEKDKKAAKKKKKEKDRDRDRDKEKQKDRQDRPMKSDRFGKPGLAAGMDANSPIKRKRDMTDGSSDKGTPNSAYKRMNMDAAGGRNRNRHDERLNKKQHHIDDYFEANRDRRNSLNSPSTPSNRNMHPAAGNPRLAPAGAAAAVGYDGRSSASPYVEGSGMPGADRWGHHNRDRFGSSDYNKRDRYDSYNRGGGGAGGYHHRDHRDRDRDRRPEKRRYPPSHVPSHNYPPHYMPPNYYNGSLPPGSGAGAPHGGYRGDARYSAGGDWPRETYPPDYRRSATGGGGGAPPGEYDRRPPPPT